MFFYFDVLVVRDPLWSLLRPDPPAIHKVGIPLSWTTIQYMVAEVQYGGRITDDLDRELFITYAAKWLNEGSLGFRSTKPNFEGRPNHNVHPCSVFRRASSLKNSRCLDNSIGQLDIVSTYPNRIWVTACPMKLSGATRMFSPNFAFNIYSAEYNYDIPKGDQILFFFFEMKQVRKFEGLFLLLVACCCLLLSKNVAVHYTTWLLQQDWTFPPFISTSKPFRRWTRP